MTMKPDQTVKVTDGKQLAREKSRQDEIGRLVNAFSTMEEEIHTLFRKSDEQSHTRLQTLDAIMRSMYGGVLLEDSEGQIVYANHRFTQFVGISAQEILLDSFQESHLTERMEAMMEEPEAYHDASHGRPGGLPENSPAQYCAHHHPHSAWRRNRQDSRAGPGGG
jgi:PAS domain-containing protein